jgi:hypothetical protein
MTTPNKAQGQMLPFVGPSYQLANRKASVQRAVNLYLVGLETPSKAPFIMQSVPGLVLFATLGDEFRGAYDADSRCFAVFGATLYEFAANGTATNRGALLTNSGPVDFAWGLTQLVVVDGTNGYVFTLASNAFGKITSANWLGSNRVAYLDGFFIFVDPGTQEFYISAIDDATTLDALDFASAESAPDDLIAHLVDHRELWLFGQLTTEVWFNSGAADFPFSRNQGASIEVGCIATFSAQKIDNSVMWIGRDKNGSGLVYRARGYQPDRVSTIAVEEALQASTDLSSAVAYVYQQNGQTFYCINAPGLTATWCYEIASGAWHERCDLDGAGQFKAHRATGHVFAFGKHLVGDAGGYFYQMSTTVYTFNGDPIKRTRISPNNALPFRQREFYAEGFTLDCTTGLAASGTPLIDLSWSDDGGFRWGNPVQRSAGALGNYYTRVCWQNVNGPEARDRVWRVDFTENAPFSIINGDAR